MRTVRVVDRLIPLGILTMVWMLCGCSDSGTATARNAENGVETNTTHVVEIKQMKFIPAELRVKNGDTVVFINNDLVTHDITEESKKSWSSSPLATDQRWKLVVTANANYFCSIHPVMKGKLIVE